MTNKNFDTCTSFHLDNGAFLGRFVRLDKTINTILEKHQYPTQVASVVAEFTSLAVLLSSSMKYDGLFTLQTKTDGPISMVVVDVTSEGKVRAYAKYDMDRIERAKELRKTTDEIEASPYLIGGGYLAFTIDQGDKAKLYQGVVDVQGKTLSEIALRYFKQSEQIDTHLKLFLQMPTAENPKWQSAGLMLQKIPQKGGKIEEIENFEEVWNESKIYLESLKESEVFDSSLSSENVINRLYHANKLVISGAKNYNFACRCSRDKLLNTLSGFDQKNIDEMAEHGKITATCSFCSEQYVFDKGELLKH
ncbi:MAG: Hsp33 family molecular chaperone HslO [Alphaproteobacteria bacterium]|nr:Hsp33 family molecular chaperone HslO [Alphaproteobacteria bacterium]